MAARRDAAKAGASSSERRAADALELFGQPTREWFRRSLGEPTEVQQQAWPAIASGRNTLLLAPTGSGKTLAAFLVALDRLMFGASADPQSRTGPSVESGGSSGRELHPRGRARSKRSSRYGPLGRRDPREPGSVRVLYLSPLKALGVDVEKNLQRPLDGIRSVASELGLPIHVPRVAVRSGDSTAAERRAIVSRPPEILITTPESLYLLLTSKASRVLRAVETVIIDEIHAVAPTKRGSHLFVSLERLEDLLREHGRRPFQRIGLSATQRPLEEIAALLGGAECDVETQNLTPRPVEIVAAGARKQLDLSIEFTDALASFLEPASVESAVTSNAAVPATAAAATALPATAAPTSEVGSALSEVHSAQMMAAVTADTAEAEVKQPVQPADLLKLKASRLMALIRAHRSTILFVNNRRSAERLAATINELAHEQIAVAHHGSIAKEARLAAEQRLKSGDLPAIVATSSLELGIDMGSVDLVIQISSPPSIAAGMQRIGRAGHQVGAASKGIVLPKFRGDVLACAAASRRMMSGEVERTAFPRNPLDVLAQQLVAMVATRPSYADDLYATVRRAAPFHELPRKSFDGVLDLLSGRYPSDQFSELRPRVTWDRATGQVTARPGAQRIAVVNAGTIPDRGLYGVYLAGATGPAARVGELDEEMVFETKIDDVFLLGATSWRVTDITEDRVLVTPAPGEAARMPFWRGEGPGRPLEFGRAIGRLARELSAMNDEAAESRLRSEHGLSDEAARTLVRYIREQSESAGVVPTDDTLVIEASRDQLGDWRVCVLSTLGARVHAPWGMAVAAALRERIRGQVDWIWSDDGLVFRLPSTDEPPPVEWFLPSADAIDEVVKRELAGSALFAARFRENAARALLLPRRQPGRRTPLWIQRRRSADLLAVAAQHPEFPLLLETFRECLRDMFDLRGLHELLSQIEKRELRVKSVSLPRPSPFAASLMFSYVGNFLYEADAPLAEKRAQALSLDHAQLRELLGETELRRLLDADLIDEYRRELQHLDGRFELRGPDSIHDLLLRIGDLSEAELVERGMPLGADWLEQLLHQRRVFRLGVAGQTRYAAIEDAGRLRDALGITPPADAPAALLEPVAHPLLDVVSRFARTRGPFRLDELTARFGIGSDPAQVALRTLVAAGRVVEGEFLPQGRGVEWCDLNVLTTLKRRSLARLRKSIAPVEPRQFARFLPYWQHVVEPRCGLDGLLDVIQQLQGFVIPLSSLERDILPRRVVDYQPSDLDQLCAAGEVVWRGYEPLGAADGRVSLFLTDQLPLLAALPGEVADGLPNQIRELLSRRGALFFDEIAKSIGGFRNDLVAALWELVWAGVVTNDTLAPLRQFDPSAASRSARSFPASGTSAGASPSLTSASPTSWSLTSRSAASAASGNVASGNVASANAASGRAASASPGGFRSRRAPRLPAAQGRWTLLERTGETQPTATERLTALALQLLARYGIVTRDMVIEEGPPGGFAALYPIYQALEERGQIRRGYFVEELGAVQFAASGADEQLRLAGLADARTITLAATDPANPFGAVLPWPRFGETESRMQRAAGARVILRDGKLLGWVARGGQQITTVTRIAPAAESSADTESDKKSRGVSKVVDGSGNEGFTGFDADELQALATAVDGLAPPEEPIFLTKIDGRAPESTDLGAELLKRGFVTTSQGLLRRRRLPDEDGHATRAAATSRRELLLPGYVATESRAAAGEPRDVEGESRGGVGE